MVADGESVVGKLSLDNASVLPRSVRRAIEAMRSTPARDFTVSELAAIAGVSGRTLQRQFQAFLGKTPVAVLRDVRLECARRALLRGSPRTTITDVALRCGFLHLGRFSIAYREAYGEQPSQTLKRQALLARTASSTQRFVPTRRERPAIALTVVDPSPLEALSVTDIADDLATALTRAGFAVTSVPPAAAYQLSCMLRKDGPRARVTFRLIERQTGRYLWADRWDDAGGSALHFEEFAATKITAAIQPCLRAAEIDRARRKPNSDLTAHDLTLRSLPFVLALDAEGNARALALLDDAISRDADSALATALAAWCHAQRVVYYFGESPDEERTRAAALAQRAQSLAGDATVLAVLGNTFTLLHDLGSADLVIRKALATDGSSAWAWSRSGWIDVYNGRDESAIERFTIALELAPHDPLAFNSCYGIACAHFHAGRYGDSARWQERTLIEHPTAAWVHRSLCPTYLLGDAQSDARRSLAALRRHYPELTGQQVMQGLPPLPKTFSDLVVEGLCSAGLPY